MAGLLSYHRSWMAPSFLAISCLHLVQSFTSTSTKMLWRNPYRQKQRSSQEQPSCLQHVGPRDPRRPQKQQRSTETREAIFAAHLTTIGRWDWNGQIPNTSEAHTWLFLSLSLSVLTLRRFVMAVEPKQFLHKDLALLPAGRYYEGCWHPT